MMNPYKSGKIVINDQKIVAFMVVDYEDNVLSYLNHEVFINGFTVKSYEYNELIPSIMKELKKLIPSDQTDGSIIF